jgi:thiol:disulfide interchange protein DsbG
MKGAHWVVMAAATLELLGGAASAAAGEFAVGDEVRGRIEALLGKNGAKLNYFPGPGGTVGVGVSMPNGKQMVVYGSADGQVLFSGVAIDTATGANLARRDLEEKLPPPDFSSVLKLARGAASIQVGDAKSGIEYFVFVDPHCPYCHRTFATFTSLAKEVGGFTVHYIPIGILGPRSENAAKGLLGMAPTEQPAALAAAMSGQPTTTSNAAIDAGDKRHQGNLAIFRNLQLQAVPVTVAVNAGEVTVVNGMPSLEELRAQLTPKKVAAR